MKSLSYWRRRFPSRASGEAQRSTASIQTFRGKSTNSPESCFFIEISFQAVRFSALLLATCTTESGNLMVRDTESLFSATSIAMPPSR